MGNVFRVLKRDVLRLLKTPQAMVVCLALLVLPSVYTWYNVLGFWDPYNNTDGVRVCIVDEDEGADSELTGHLDLGSQIVEQLHENHQLDWYFTDYDDALAQVKSGTAYAAIVIPPTFSADLLTITTGDFVQPELDYYVNEKAGPVAPKITDTGVNTLDETINSTFVSTVTGVVASNIDTASAQAEQRMDGSKRGALGKIDDAAAKVGALRDSLSELREAGESASAKAEEARGALTEAKGAIEASSEGLSTVGELVRKIDEGVNVFSANLADVSVRSLSLLAELSNDYETAQKDVREGLGRADGALADALEEGRGIVESERKLLDEADALLAELPEDSAAKEPLADLIERRRVQAELLSQQVEALDESRTAAGEALGALDGAGEQISEASKGALEAVQSSSSAFYRQTLPRMSSELADLGGIASDLSGALARTASLVDQCSSLVDEVQSTLQAAEGALGQTDALLSGVEEELGTVRTDVAALHGANVLQNLTGEDSLNASVIADFMGSPTKLRTEQLYPLNAYGSAMAPLFMNLTFWIGAFMLVVVMRQEVDSEGIRNLKLYQRYLGRFALMGCMVVLQAVICCAGLLLIGVEPVSAPALFLAAVVAALAYLSIIYALSVTLQHIGKGICILLVFAQIPGATGLYPVEMTSSFFQTVYPFMPFTYGINALREAICGFYGNHYAEMLCVLVAFFAVFLALGLIFRPLLANVNLMVARQVRQGGIFNGENAEVPERPCKFSQIVRALSDRKEYNRELTARYARFLRWYPRIIRGSIVAGVAMPIALFLLFALTPAEKVALLTIWLLWLVALFVGLIVVESLRASFERQLSLDHISDEHLRALYRRRDAMSGEADGSSNAAASAPSAEGEGR